MLQIIQSKSTNNNDICQAAVDLKPDVIIMSAIMENQSIVTIFSNPSYFLDNGSIKSKAIGIDVLRNILSNGSQFVVDLSNNNMIKSKKYVFVKSEHISVLIVPLTIKDTPNRILGISYLTQSDMGEESKLIELVVGFSKSITL